MSAISNYKKTVRKSISAKYDIKVFTVINRKPTPHKKRHLFDTDAFLNIKK